MRQWFVRVHRWAGLAMAGFLILVGLTGSLLVFAPELNALLSPRLFPGEKPGDMLGLGALAERAETIVPQAQTKSVHLNQQGSAAVGMSPRDETAELDFDQLFLDRATGAELGRRLAGPFPTNLEMIMPFIYPLHYRLVAGETGAWILGIVALVWTIDCFVGFYLTLPAPSANRRRGFWSRWSPAWLVRTGASTYRLNFDLHRAGGLWLWALLLVFAWSAVAFNLNGAYTAVTGLAFEFVEPEWAEQDEALAARPFLGWRDAQQIATRLMQEQAQRNGFAIVRPESMAVNREEGWYNYTVKSSRDPGEKYGATRIYFDARDGALLSVDLPTGQHAGNTISTWLSQIHMANVFGLPFRILVCALGGAVAMLSVTGVHIWWRKRTARGRMTITAAASQTSDRRAPIF